MKIAFMQAYDPKYLYHSYLPPLGLGYLMSYVKRECWFIETSFHHKVETLIAEKPDIAAIGACSENFTDAQNHARRIKDELGIPVVVGNMHITALPHTLPQIFDVGVCGEGEISFAEILTLYKRTGKLEPHELTKINGICFHDNGKVHITPPVKLIKDLDILPYPDRDTLGDGWASDPSNEIHMVSSRGCPYRCSFCTSANNWKPFRFFSSDYVVKEIEYIRNKYNPKIIYFFDDLFIGHIGRFKEIVDKFKASKIYEGVDFRFYARADLMQDWIGEACAELNFHYIDFGFESNNPNVLKYLTKTKVKPETNQKCVDICRKYGLSLGGNFIMASPQETLEDMMDTYNFVERNRDVFDRVSMGPLHPNPGTPIWTEALQKGIVTEDMDFGRLAVTYDSFDKELFPYMSEVTPIDDFFNFWTKFNVMARDINNIGQMRRMVREKARISQAQYRAESELRRLKGSRMVQWALQLRDLKDKVVSKATKTAAL